MGICKDHGAYMGSKCIHCLANETPKEETGLKFDSNKLQWSLLPIEPIRQIVKVLMFGAKKYEANNWQLVVDAETRYYDALLRHIFAWKDGEVFDPETKLHHLAHAGCNVIFLLWFELQTRVREKMMGGDK